jgi:hypothetical protein
MLALGFADWAFWEAYAPPNFLGEQKVVFDGVKKLILVSYGVTELDFRIDVYSAWKEWQKDPNHVNAAYVEAITVVGGQPLPGNRALGSTFFLTNGWRMRTWEGDHSLTVTGNFFTTEGDPAFVKTLLPWTITVNLNTSTLVETIIPQTSLSEGDVTTIVDAVWNTTLQDSSTALAVLNSIVTDIGQIPASVWDEIIDGTKNQSAREKLRKIATKTQDIALR